MKKWVIFIFFLVGIFALFVYCFFRGDTFSFSSFKKLASYNWIISIMLFLFYFAVGCLNTINFDWTQYYYRASDKDKIIDKITRVHEVTSYLMAALAFLAAGKIENIDTLTPELKSAIFFTLMALTFISVGNHEKFANILLYCKIAFLAVAISFLLIYLTKGYKVQKSENIFKTINSFSCRI